MTKFRKFCSTRRIFFSTRYLRRKKRVEDWLANLCALRLILGRLDGFPFLAVLDFVILNKFMYTDASRRSTSLLALCSFLEFPFGRAFVVDGAELDGVNFEEDGVFCEDVAERFFFGMGPKRRFVDVSGWASDFVNPAGDGVEGCSGSYSSSEVATRCRL